MSLEILALFAFIGTFAALLFAQPLALAKAQGLGYVLGNRGGGTGVQDDLVGRLNRTVNNTMEAAVLFVPLVLMTEVLGASNALTRYGALTFVVVRVAYAVIYTFGIGGVRTLVWNVGVAALAAMAVGILVA